MRFIALVFASLLSLEVVADDHMNGIKAPTGEYRNDPGHTSLHWRINHLGLSNYTARLNDVSIDLDFNAEDISKSSVSATIDPPLSRHGISG